MPRIDTLQFRRGTAAAWTAQNPTLLAGEPGFESDTGKGKLGNGTAAWSALPYMFADLAMLLNRSNHTGTQPASTISDFAEAAQDAVAALLQGASGVSLSYNDAGNTLTITGGGAGGLDAEAVRDAIGVALIGVGNISVIVNDAADTITITTTATQNDTDANLRARSSHTGTQPSSTISDFAAAADARVAAAAPVPYTLIDAKGDILVGTANDAITRRGIGADGTVLTAVSGEPQWASPVAGAGSAKREVRNFMRPFSKVPYPASDLVGTVTPTTTPPSYASMINWTWSSYGSLFRYSGIYTSVSGVGYNQINGQTGGSAITGSIIEWYQPGDRFSLNMQSYGNHDYRIFVDGMPLTINWTHYPTTAAYYDLPVQFQTSRTRRITLVNGQTGFNLLRTPGTPVFGQPYPAEPRLKMAVITDSFWHGGVSAAGAISAGTLAGEFMMATGIEVWNLAQGGTGYQNGGGGSTANGPNGASPFGSAARLAALAALPAMDLMMVFGGVNDASLSTFPVSTTVTKANALWNAMKAARPNTPLIVAGIQSGVYPTIVGDMTTLANAIKAAAQANSNVNGFVDMFTDPDRWVQGDGNETNKTGNGNADLFVSGPPGDSIHPNHEGDEYHAGRLANKVAPMQLIAA